MDGWRQLGLQLKSLNMCARWFGAKWNDSSHLRTLRDAETTFFFLQLSVPPRAMLRRLWMQMHSRHELRGAGRRRSS